MPSDAYSVEQLAGFRKNLDWAVKKQTPYVWGGANEKGADCSGLLHWAARRAGMAVNRTTSLRMAQGYGGWGDGIDIHSVRQLRDNNCAWFTWAGKPGRPFGHVAVRVDTKLGARFLHASSTARKVVLSKVEGVFVRDFALGRDLLTEKPKVVIQPVKPWWKFW